MFQCGFLPELPQYLLHWFSLHSTLQFGWSFPPFNVLAFALRTLRVNRFGEPLNLWCDLRRDLAQIEWPCFRLVP